MHACFHDNQERFVIVLQPSSILELDVGFGIDDVIPDDDKCPTQTEFPTSKLDQNTTPN